MSVYFHPIDYEMSTLSKPSCTNEGDKFTSVVHSEPEHETSKVSLDENRKAMATQTDITMESIIWGTLEGPSNPEKRVDL